MRQLHIAVAQVNSRACRTQANLDRIHRQVQAASVVGAELILFAETAIHAYDVSPENIALAEPLTGPLCRQLLAWAECYHIAICAGFLELEADHIYNSCAVARPDGRIGAERKHCLTPAEIDAKLTPGPRERMVLEFNGIRVAVLVCADTGMEGLNDLLRAQNIEYKLLASAGGGKLDEMLTEADLLTPEGREKYEKNRARVFNTKAILSEEDSPVCGFASANALGYDGKNACHQGHCMIVDNHRVMRAQIPGTIVMEHQQDQMVHAVLDF